VFTESQRKSVRERLLAIASLDNRLESAAVVGSSAEGEDRWSDLDLTFGLADGAVLKEVLADWTARVKEEFHGIHLFDLPWKASLYRVFLLPGNLQVDLSFTPGAEFGPHGPRFKLLYGKVGREEPPTTQSKDEIFGYAVHHLVRARICIERERLWQAMYWVDEGRERTMALACMLQGLESSNGRGFDGLPPELLSKFEATLTPKVERLALLEALRKNVGILLEVSKGAILALDEVEASLRALESETLS